MGQDFDPGTRLDSRAFDFDLLDVLEADLREDVSDIGVCKVNVEAGAFETVSRNAEITKVADIVHKLCDESKVRDGMRPGGIAETPEGMVSPVAAGLPGISVPCALWPSDLPCPASAAEQTVYTVHAGQQSSAPRTVETAPAAEMAATCETLAERSEDVVDVRTTQDEEFMEGHGIVSFADVQPESLSDALPQGQHKLQGHLLDTPGSLNPALELDVPLPRLFEFLAPVRLKLTRHIQDSLRDYDAGRGYPRPQDRRHDHRDGLEAHLRGEAVRELRTTMQRQFPQEPVLWKIVGGAEYGGIIVREGSDLVSRKVPERLSTGALVQELELSGERLRYRLLEGHGPSEGWVSLKVKGQGRVPDKPLATRTNRAAWEKAVRSSAATSRSGAIVVVALMAAHISTQARVTRFHHVLRSIERQELSPVDAEFVVAISWSTSSPELGRMVRAALREFCHDEHHSVPRATSIARFAIEQEQPHSQFQHLQAALAVAEAELRRRHRHSATNGGGFCGDANRSAWVIFGDDDDLWHPRRVSEYVRAIRSHHFLEGVGIFATTNRAMPRGSRTAIGSQLPTNSEEVDQLLARGHGIRLEREDPCREWRKTLRSAGISASSIAVSDDLPMEYFDFCPRLRLLREFFSRTSSSMLAHRYCDLRFLEFLMTYPRQGCEMGLEVSFFEPAAWMYFYSCFGIDEKQWERSVEKGDDSTNTIGLQGHMSSEVKLEPDDFKLADRVYDDFQVYDPSLTKARLARYWAAFRNTLELGIVRLHTRKLDQRVFDGYVFMAVNCSFFKFAEKVNSLPQERAERAVRMMMRVGQDYARSLAARFDVGVLWHRPDGFIEPPRERRQQQPVFHWSPQPQTPWSQIHQKYSLPVYAPFSQPTYSPFAQQPTFVSPKPAHSPFSLDYPGMYY